MANDGNGKKPSMGQHVIAQLTENLDLIREVRTRCVADLDALERRTESLIGDLTLARDERQRRQAAEGKGQGS